jgi:hypothetical protein
MSVTSQDVIPTPFPNVDRVAQHEAYPIKTPEMIRHEEQIILRPRHIDRNMELYGALRVVPTSRGPLKSELIAPLGTFTYFSLRRMWVLASDRQTPVVSIMLAGYKSSLDEGKILIGGGRYNVCVYDLRFRPFHEASEGGKIISSRKRSTLHIGLCLDFAVERCAKKETQPEPYLTMPQYWAGFRQDSLPVVEDCQAARKLAVEAVRSRYDGPVLPGLRSPGGRITCVSPSSDGGTCILFNSHGAFDGTPILLPRTAVLRPYVREGAIVAEGAPLADFVPRRDYPSIGKIAGLYGEDIADWLVREAVAATDIRSPDFNGLVLRRAELCSSQLENATMLYEDIRPLLTPDGQAVRTQVVRTRNLNPLCPNVCDTALADFVNIRPEWEHKFKPLPSRR